MKYLLVAFFMMLFISRPLFASEHTVISRLQRHSLHKLKQKIAGLAHVPGRKIALFEADDDSGDDSGDDNNDDAQAATPHSLEDDEVSPEIVEITPQGPVTASQPWEKPNYSDQTGALGYSSNVFSVPEGLKNRVSFWKDIYTKYTTNQGVMHDSLHTSIVYQSVDFGSIMRDNSLNPRQKHHAREHLVKSYRKEIEARLKKLSKLSSSEGLSGEDLRVWKLFESIHDPDKFNAATRRSRIRFQLGQRDRFALGIYYSGRYIREMEKIFKSESLPIELTRLPFVESSFNIYARSRVGASGIWQFMRKTARPYMMINNSVDERNDPLKATRSSARLLRSNFMLLRSWPLALTGYNHGPSGIARIVRKTGTTDLAQIINTFSSRRFGFASENFYACFLAALEVEKNADKYFPGAKWSVPLEHAEIKLTKPISFDAVKIWFKDDAELAQLYNPHFSGLVRRGWSNMPKGTVVRVPVEMREIADKFVNGNMKLAEMKVEATLAYDKSAALNDHTAKVIKEELTEDREDGLLITVRK